MLILDTPSTYGYVQTALAQKPAQSLVGLSCTLHTPDGPKPALITAQTPYSYTIEARDGTYSTRLPKTQARAMWPNLTPTSNQQ